VARFATGNVELTLQTRWRGLLQAMWSSRYRHGGGKDDVQAGTYEL